jgi:hypothetical protein
VCGLLPRRFNRRAIVDDDQEEEDIQDDRHRIGHDGDDDDILAKITKVLANFEKSLEDASMRHFSELHKSVESVTALLLDEPDADVASSVGSNAPPTHYLFGWTNDEGCFPPFPCPWFRD